MVEDCFDDGGGFGGAGAEVSGGAVECGVAEQGLDLGDVGAALAQPGGVAVSEPVRAQTRDASVIAGGKHDLGDACSQPPLEALRRLTTHVE